MMPNANPKSPVPAWVYPAALQGRLIRLESLNVRHAPALLRAAEPSVFRYMRLIPEWTLEGFERHIEELLSQSDSYAMAIVLNETNQSVGRIRYSRTRINDRALEIGTWIGPRYQGTGANPEAKYLLLHYAFEQLSPTVIRVQFPVNANNQQSIRAIEKLGAVREGVLRKSRFVRASMEPNAPDVAMDMVIYSIIADEWPAIRAKLEKRIGWSM